MIDDDFEIEEIPAENFLILEQASPEWHSRSRGFESDR